MTTGTNETTRLLGPLGAEVMHVLWSTRDTAMIHFVEQVRANPRLHRRLQQLLDQPGST